MKKINLLYFLLPILLAACAGKSTPPAATNADIEKINVWRFFGASFNFCKGSPEQLSLDYHGERLDFKLNPKDIIHFAVEDGLVTMQGDSVPDIEAAGVPQKLAHNEAWMLSNFPMQEQQEPITILIGNCRGKIISYPPGLVK